MGNDVTNGIKMKNGINAKSENGDPIYFAYVTFSVSILSHFAFLFRFYIDFSFISFPCFHFPILGVSRVPPRVFAPLSRELWTDLNMELPYP